MANNFHSTQRDTKAGTIGIVPYVEQFREYVKVFNFRKGSCIWISEKNEKYVASGGVGFAPATRMLSARLYKQRMPLERLSSFFFTTHQSPNNPEHKALSLYDLNDLTSRQIIDLKKKEVLHVDCNLAGDLFVITLLTADSHSRHIFAQKEGKRDQKRGKNFDLFRGWYVLAFDPLNSIAVVQSFHPRDEATPILYVHQEDSDSKDLGKNLCFQELPISPAESYSAQIKENHMAILVSGLNRASLFLIPLPLVYSNISELTDYLIPSKELENHSIGSFTLYDDIIILLTRTPDDKPGPLAIFRLASLATPPTIISVPTTNIVGREGDVILCKTETELIAVNFKDLKTNVLTKLESDHRVGYVSKVIE